MFDDVLYNEQGINGIINWFIHLFLHCQLCALCLQNHRRPKLSLWGVTIFFKKTFMRTLSLWNELSWHSYRRHLLLHNDLTRNVTLAFQHVEVLCYNGLNLQRFVWGKTLKGISAEILIFFNKKCLFYCPFAFQSDPKPFKRVIAFRVSSPKKE